MVSSTADVARPTSIRIFPENATIPLAGMEQQIAVIASFPDGTSRDVTREAFVESSDIEVVRAGDRALVTACGAAKGRCSRATRAATPRAESS
jgi:hypothetical protein